MNFTLKALSNICKSFTKLLLQMFINKTYICAYFRKQRLLSSKNPIFYDKEKKPIVSNKLLIKIYKKNLIQ